MICLTLSLTLSFTHLKVTAAAGVMRDGSEQNIYLEQVSDGIRVVCFILELYV